MTDPSQNPSNSGNRRNLLVCLLFPVALFPLLALLTYDADTFYRLPTPVSTNWIGALGDGFAHYGYHLFGLAIWVVPPLAILGVLALRIRTGSFWKRLLCALALIACIACLLQSAFGAAEQPGGLCRRLNILNTGGAVGYLLMTRLLSPLLSNFGAAILILILLVIVTITAIGYHNLISALGKIGRWALARERITDPSNASPNFGSDANPEQERYLNALRAKAEAQRQKEAEKEAARIEKERRREEKARIKEEKRQAKLAAQQPQATTTAAIPAPPPSRAPETAAVVDDKGPYILPSLSLLNPLKKSTADHGDVGEMSRKLLDTLKLFGIDATLSYTVQGPVVTKYAITLAPGVRYSAVTNISDNLMGSLHAKSLRIEAPIPGEECVGIEVPNRASAGISFREIIESETWKNFKGELPLLFGKDAAGRELVADLAKMPHMLVAGATGQGKSVCLNAIINGLLMTKTPEQLKLIMVDPKSVEFTSYTSIPHLIVPIITDNRKVVFSLHWAVAEMEKRLKMFARARVRNIYDFNHRLQFTQTDMFGNDTEVGSDMPKTVPYIVIIIDEVADLMAAASKEVTPDISRLTAKARAAGIHLILATQRPDAKIITGTIKANIPGRVAFKTATSIDSRTILDDGGAENLIGKGDMLFRTADGLLIRAQGAWISDPEIARITHFIEEHSNTQFDDKFATKLSRVKEAGIADPFADNEDDPDNQQPAESASSTREQVKSDAAASDFKKAIECIINTKRASTSHFQRQLGWGYNHAAKILDMLESRGVVSPQSGMGPRQIVMDQDQLLAIFNGNDNASGDAMNATSESPAPAMTDATTESAGETDLFTTEENPS